MAKSICKYRAGDSKVVSPRSGHATPERLSSLVTGAVIPQREEIELNDVEGHVCATILFQRTSMPGAHQLLGS